MPPKGKVADGTDGHQERLLAGAQSFLATCRPVLTEEQYEALIPRHTEGPYWTAQDEDDLQAEGRFADILRRGKEIWVENDGARQLWRLFPRLYRCLPTDLFSWANQVDVDTSTYAAIAQGPHAGALNVVWSKGFCRMVTKFTMHGFWTYEREWDFPVMAQLMQLAVICRKNDCRPWRLVNHTDDIFLTLLADEIRKPVDETRTIKDIVGAVVARMDARNKRARPTEFRLLFCDVVTELFRPTAGPLVDGTPGPYRVTLQDLQGLVKCLDRLAPSPDRTQAGMTTGLTAEEWKSNMEAARGHSGKNQKAEPLPTKENDLLARAIAFGLMARVRDQKISERRAEAGEESDAQSDSDDPFKELVEPPKDVQMADVFGDEGLDAPLPSDDGLDAPLPSDDGLDAPLPSDDGPVDGAVVEQQPQAVAAQPVAAVPVAAVPVAAVPVAAAPVEDPSSEDQQYSEMLKTAKKHNRFTRHMAPDPKRGRCDKGPFPNEPRDDDAQFWNVEK